MSNHATAVVMRLTYDAARRAHHHGTPPAAALVRSLALCAVNALSIADRYAMSTVLKPLRIELQLTDSGVTSTGWSRKESRTATASSLRHASALASWRRGQRRGQLAYRRHLGVHERPVPHSRCSLGRTSSRRVHSTAAGARIMFLNPRQYPDIRKGGDELKARLRVSGHGGSAPG